MLWQLNPFPNKLCFYVFAIEVHYILKTPCEKEKLLVTSNFSFSHSVFYTVGELLPFPSNLKLSSDNSFSLEQSKICGLEKG